MYAINYTVDKLLNWQLIYIYNSELTFKKKRKKENIVPPQYSSTFQLKLKNIMISKFSFGEQNSQNK